jgi:hypothetical protein|tara:strand:- start:241 stop:633 length:393 start_codon:yes stop_codon:yes gene_type:complete
MLDIIDYATYIITMIDAARIGSDWQSQGGVLGEEEQMIVDDLVDAYNTGDPQVIAEMASSAMEGADGLDDTGDLGWAALIRFTKEKCESALSADSPNVLFEAEMKRKPTLNERREEGGGDGLLDQKSRFS